MSFIQPTQSMARRIRWLAGLLMMLNLIWFTGPAFAGDATDLSGIAGNVATNVKALGSMLVIIAYVAGLGFALAGVLQFKAHKDNPAQVPLSKPVVYIAVSAGLLFLPALMESASVTIFGGTSAAASSGSGSSGLEGGAGAPPAT